MTVPTSADELRLLGRAHTRSSMGPHELLTPSYWSSLFVVHPTAELAARWLETMAARKSNTTLRSVGSSDLIPYIEKLRKNEVGRLFQSRLRRLENTLSEAGGATVWLGSGLAMPHVAFSEPPEFQTVASREQIAWTWDEDEEYTPALTPTDILTYLVWVAPNEEARLRFRELARRDAEAAGVLLERDRLTPDRGHGPNRTLSKVLTPDDLAGALAHGDADVRRLAMRALGRLE